MNLTSGLPGYNARSHAYILTLLLQLLQPSQSFLSCVTSASYMKLRRAFFRQISPGSMFFRGPTFFFFFFAVVLLSRLDKSTSLCIRPRSWTVHPFKRRRRLRVEIYVNPRVQRVYFATNACALLPSACRIKRYCAFFLMNNTCKHLHTYAGTAGVFICFIQSIFIIIIIFYGMTFSTV